MNYRSLPPSFHPQLDLELQQMPTSRTTSHLSTSASLGGTSDDQQHLLMTGVTIEARPQKSSVERPDRSKKSRLQGWRFGLAMSTSAATLILITNVVVVVVAASTSRIENGIGTLHTGNCTLVNRWNTALHVLINVISSVLLGASNYAMQCLTSPTRSDCNDAHARGDWLDIGVAGVRNLTKISRRRRVLWALLASSSIPIHLLFNSAVFKTLDANEYDLFVVREDLLEGAQITSHLSGDITLWGESLTPIKTIDWVMAAQQRYLEGTSFYEYLSPQECISNYDDIFVSGHSNLFLVTKNTSADDNFFGARRISYIVPGEGKKSTYGPLTDDSNVWICDKSEIGHEQYCDSAAVLEAAGDWTILGQKIDHCRAEVTPGHCSLEFSVYILVAVILCNFIKSAALFWTLLYQRENTLVTFGDALASFLEFPDGTTTHRCLMSKKDVISFQRGSFAGIVDTPPPVAFTHRKKHRWHEAVSRKRWVISMVSCIAAIAAGVFLLDLSLAENYSPDALVELGFGSFDPSLIINVGIAQEGTAGLTECVMLANLPQVILSFLYLMYNGLYTSMHLAHEYGGYATERKALRVTSPRGTQRSTYWLQLPYTYGVPLIMASATLHWLVSQSIFLARVSVWTNGVRTEGQYTASSALGYSPAPILSAVVLGICMLVVAVGMGWFRRLPSSIPIAGSCSMALAAAAHSGSDVDAFLLPVKWGVVRARESESAGDIGHCCFTSEEVTELQEYKRYAGDMSDTVDGPRLRARY